MTCHAARRPGEFEHRLRESRREVSRAIAVADVELDELDGDRPIDRLDDAARELARGVLGRLEARDRAALTEITAAEARLAAGTYGVCEGCGRFITVARLRALPVARLCLACEVAAEVTAR